MCVRLRGGGAVWNERSEFMKNPVNLFLELKIVSTFKGEISPPSDRHDRNAKASEDKQKARLDVPEVIRHCQGTLYTSDDCEHPAGLSQILVLYFTGFFFLFSSKQQFTTQGLTVIFIKLQVVQVCERCIIT